MLLNQFQHIFCHCINSLTYQLFFFFFRIHTLSGLFSIFSWFIHLPCSRKYLTGSLAAQKYVLKLNTEYSLYGNNENFQNPSFLSLPFPPFTLPFFQSLSKLLDEDLEHPLDSEEWDHEEDDLIPAGVFDQQDTELPWIQTSREQPRSREQSKSISLGDSAIQRFFSDLLSSARRQKQKGRRKKGPSRGCFGVRLDRIGSLSGLGCWLCYGKRKPEAAGLCIHV